MSVQREVLGMRAAARKHHSLRCKTALPCRAAQRRELRNYLEGAGRASPLFDTTATTRALERAYVHMAEQYRRRIREPILIES